MGPTWVGLKATTKDWTRCNNPTDCAGIIIDADTGESVPTEHMEMLNITITDPGWWNHCLMLTPDGKLYNEECSNSNIIKAKETICEVFCESESRLISLALKDRDRIFFH